MLKWLLVVALAAIVLGFAAPRLRRLGLGRLPGDFHFRHRGREYYLPVASTVLLSIVLTLIARIFRF